MKKKILVATLAISMAFAGVASAASLWGTYKGNQIIRLTVNGNPVKVSDVPALSYQGRTMVPVYLLQQAGVNYKWDGKNQTVNITKTPDSAQDVKDLVTVSDYYNSLASLGDQIRGLSEHLRLVYEANKYGYDYTFDYKMFNDIIDTYNAANKESGTISATLKLYDKDLTTILNNYAESLEEFKNAFIQLDNYIQTNNQNYAMNYTDSANNAFDTAHDGTLLAINSYKAVINMILAP